MASPERELCAWVTALNERLRASGQAEATPAEINLYFKHGKTPEKAAERIAIFRAPLQSVFAETASGEAGKPPSTRA